MSNNTPLSSLLETLPQRGELRWIGIRPASGECMQEPTVAQLDENSGLKGDRYCGKSGKRHVTLIQFEHLATISSLLHIEAVNPAQLRRNLAVSAINLLALKNKQFSIGNTRLEYTGLCHPCSQMEKTFGTGGYNAVRGHGGITARVIVGGEIHVGDAVVALTDKN
jgi:MOSC domain-containing protein YiiM